MPRLPPRRAALLIAAIAGLSAGAMGFVPLVVTRYWPEDWGGFAVSLMLFGVLFPPMLVVQKAMLRRLFRWSGLRLIDLLESLETGNIRDDGFFMLLMGAGLATILFVQHSLLFLLPADEEGTAFTVFPMAIVWYFGMVQNAAIWASAEAFPDQKPEDAEEELDPGPPISFTRTYLAAVANLALAGPLLFWLIRGLLAAPVAPIVGMLTGATIGTVLGIGHGTRPGLPSWHLLAGGLILADLAAAAVGLPAVWAMTAYGYAESDWLPTLAMLAALIGMIALTGFTAERAMRRVAGGGKNITGEARP